MGPWPGAVQKLAKKTLPHKAYVWIYGDHWLPLDHKYRESLRNRVTNYLKHKFGNIRELEPHERLSNIQPELDEMEHVENTAYDNKLTKLTVTLKMPVVQDKVKQAAAKAGIRIHSSHRSKYEPTTALYLTHWGIRKSLLGRRWNIEFETKTPTKLVIKHWPHGPEDFIHGTHPITMRHQRKIVEFVRHLE